MSRKCGTALCFHGGFKDKSRAEARERKHKSEGAFILRRLGRWIVATPKRGGKK